MMKHEAKRADVTSEARAGETYTISNLRCDNCGWRQYDLGKHVAHPIPKGQAVRDTDCPKCGVKGLSARPW